jgi:putative flippase GtrA
MKNILRQFRGREHGPVVQFIKYAVAGGIATVFHIVMFYCLAAWVFPALGQNDVVASLLHLRVTPVSDAIRARNSVIDNAITFCFSNMVAYLINILWVFEGGRHHRVLEIAFFYMVSGISTVIGTSLMGFLIKQFGIMTTIAFGANALVSLMINYILRKKLIFKG